MDSCLLLVLEPRAPGLFGVNNNYFHMYDTFYLPSRWIRFDQIPILNSRSSYIYPIYTCTYVRTFNKAYYCENNAAERRRNASSFVERKNTVGRYPLYTNKAFDESIFYRTYRYHPRYCSPQRFAKWKDVL